LHHFTICNFTLSESNFGFLNAPDLDDLEHVPPKKGWATEATRYCLGISAIRHEIIEQSRLFLMTSGHPIAVPLFASSGASEAEFGGLEPESWGRADFHMPGNRVFCNDTRDLGEGEMG
jgi:hypothetical protein